MKVFSMVLKHVNARLLLVGDGPERHNIEQLCRELDICEKVSFLGKQDAIEEILSICDLFLMPSETESFGLAALEAMACEVPVVSSNAGGIPELNIEGETGYLCNVGDVDAMAEKSIFLLSDEQRLKTFKQKAKQRALLFDIDKIVPLYEDCYNRVLQQVQTAIGG
jgi:N-acetyl-alpha-D-glucosaminyl L-malate synthase BshA